VIGNLIGTETSFDILLNITAALTLLSYAWVSQWGCWFAHCYH
jgi:hypothetical protein